MKVHHKVLALVGSILLAGAVGVTPIALQATGVAPASSASATHPTVNGTFECNADTGLFDINWTVGGDTGYPTETATVTSESVTIADDSFVGRSVTNDETISGWQYGVTPGDYELTVEVQWTNHEEGDWVEQTGYVTVSGDCTDSDSKKITFCHATSSETNPFEKIETSLAAFFNSGHIDHDGDIFPAGSFVHNGDTQSWDAQGDQSLLAYPDCEKPIVVDPGKLVAELYSDCIAVESGGEPEGSVISLYLKNTTTSDHTVTVDINGTLYDVFIGAGETITNMPFFQNEDTGVYSATVYDESDNILAVLDPDQDSDCNEEVIIEVTPVAPVITQPTCDTKGSIVVPEQPTGVIVTNNPDGSVDFSPAKKYSFPEGTETHFGPLNTAPSDCEKPGGLALTGDTINPIVMVSALLAVLVGAVLTISAFIRRRLAAE